MLIDWFTVGAQMLNFLILVGLLKRFLYKPILSAIDTREKNIAAEVAQAAATKATADKERTDFQKKSAALEEQRGVLLAKAVEEANAERERRLTQARQAAEALRVQYETALQNDQTRLSKEISSLARTEIFQITRQTLADLAAATLEERIGEVFTRRLREMNGDAKALLALGISGSAVAIVRSTFEMPSTSMASIQTAINETFAADVRLRFEASPRTISGIELAIGEHRLAWSIADYLAELEKKVESLVSAQARAPDPPGKTPATISPST